MRGVLLAILLGAVACSATPSLSKPALPTLTSDNGACREIGLMGATLAGSPADPRVAWLEFGDEGRREILWPPGFTAQFTPELEILDASRTVVFRAGDAISGGCTAGPADDPGQLLVIRPGY